MRSHPSCPRRGLLPFGFKLRIRKFRSRNFKSTKFRKDVRLELRIPAAWWNSSRQKLLSWHPGDARKYLSANQSIAVRSSHTTRRRRNENLQRFQFLIKPVEL